MASERYHSLPIARLSKLSSILLWLDSCCLVIDLFIAWTWARRSLSPRFRGARIWLQTRFNIALACGSTVTMICVLLDDGTWS